MLCAAQALCKLFKHVARKSPSLASICLRLEQEEQLGHYVLSTVQYSLKFSGNIPL
jgi:hypothetical protein